MKVYEERGITLDSPTFGGEKTDLTYHLKGTIDQRCAFCKRHNTSLRYD